MAIQSFNKKNTVQQQMKVILRADWLAKHSDLRTKATGEETFERVSFTCTPWCPINLHHNISASILILHVIAYINRVIK